VFLGGARLHKSDLRLDEIWGIKGVLMGLWGSIDKPNLSFDDNNDDVINNESYL